jgi:hypothetical protein
MLHKVQHFCEQEKSVPCCRRRFYRSPGETPGLMNQRVSPVIEISMLAWQPAATWCPRRIRVCAIALPEPQSGPVCQSMPDRTERLVLPVAIRCALCPCSPAGTACSATIVRSVRLNNVGKQFLTLSPHYIAHYDCVICTISGEQTIAYVGRCLF